MTSSVVFYSFVLFVEQGFEAVNLGQIKTKSINLLSFYISSKSILVQLHYILSICLIFLTIRASAVESWRIRQKTGLGDRSSSHCCGFLTIGKFQNQAYVFQSLAFFERPKIFSDNSRSFFKLGMDLSCVTWGKSLKRHKLQWCASHHLSEWECTRPSPVLNFAHVRCWTF